MKQEKEIKSLSEKILVHQSCGNNPCILKDDVKEFIRDLKEEVKIYLLNDIEGKEFDKIIHKLAGPDLI